MSSDELTTDLTVESWSLGEPRAEVQVLGGQEPDAITSVEWGWTMGIEGWLWNVHRFICRREWIGPRLTMRRRRGQVAGLRCG